MKYIDFLILFHLFLFPVFVFGQADFSISKEEDTKLYATAIAEYVKAVYKKDQMAFDTLFIGKHEELPEIKLPSSIQNTNILLLTSAEADKKLEYRQLVYLNVIENISKEHSHFIIVTFHVSKTKRYSPQFNCLINLKHVPKSKEPELVNLKFAYVYSKKE
jgi:hypothetical protein